MVAVATPTLPPPPGTDSGPGPGPDRSTPTSIGAGSPSPAQPSPMGGVTKLVIDTVSNLRAIAKAVPETAALVSQVNDLMRQIGLKAMQHAAPGESMSPPNG